MGMIATMCQMNFSFNEEKSFLIISMRASMVRPKETAATIKTVSTMLSMGYWGNP